MLKYTPNTFKKITELLKEIGYQLRTGKGSFNSGYCILQAKKVVVINNYHSLEAQINTLVDIVLLLIPSEESEYIAFLSEDTLKFYKTIQQHNHSLSISIPSSTKPS